FELGPDFAVVGVEDRQTALDVRAVKHAGVGDEDHFQGGRGRGEGGGQCFIRTSHSTLRTSNFSLALYLGTRCNDLVEVLVRRRFAVAGEGDIVEAAEVGGDACEFGRFVNAATYHDIQHSA